MAQRDIRIYGDPVLREAADPVAEINDEIRRFVDDLFETMYASEGVGLAAPQVGRLARIFVVDTSEQEEGGRGPMAFINPVILATAGEWRFDEGCLSIPGVTAEITRPMTVNLRYWTPEGEERTEEFDGLLGRVIQHENDHLDGKLFVDYLSPMRRALIMKKLRELSREPESPAL
ncbi:MAG: peptide deformylase [Candidatus Eisenbacteria bacterium]|nr:peptide deformylase [Candidatus Eisenbacteria bacterium]